jgi:hypothetical protein
MRPRRPGLTKTASSGDTATRTPLMIRIVELPDPAHTESGPVDNWLNFLADVLADVFRRDATR